MQQALTPIESPPGELKAVRIIQRWKPWLIAAAALLVAILLTHTLRGLLAEFSYQQVVNSINEIAPRAVALALAATFVSYVALTGYDFSSLRYVGASVPYSTTAQTAFIAFALSNTVGLGVLTGGAVRMRLYGAAGVEAGAIARAIAFNAAAFGIGVSVVGAAASVWGAETVASALGAPSWLVRAIALAVLIAAAVLIALCLGRERTLFGRIRVRLPSLSLALRQLFFSAVDIIAATAVLWFLLPPGSIGFAPFVGFFAIATTLGVLSHVPGGLGVFEAIMLLALQGKVPADALAAALVMYRLIYYVLPLLLALGLLVLHELRGGAGSAATRAAASVAPLLLAAYTLVVGVILLISGVTPTTEEATKLLALHVPLPLVEASHFLGSIAGLALLFVARGMLLRLDAAWWAGLLISIASLLMAFLKGFAIFEAILIGCLVVALAVSRGQFTRRASLFAQPFTGGWLLSVAGILLALTGLLFFAYRDVAYTDELWWRFELDGHAPRSLRALVAVTLVALVLALRQLFRPAYASLPKPDADELKRAAAVLRNQERADAGIALTGDKHFLFSESGDAFVMFGRRGRSWVGLFDPVGPQSEWTELVWRFIEMSRAHGGRASFYQVRPDTLPVYLDAGLRALKLGEYAHVPLAEFSLKGKSRAGLRQAVNRGARAGLHLEVVPAEAVHPMLPELRRISDAWLAEHNAAEKSFSLGSFDDAYVQSQPVAIVREDSRIVAFATLLETGCNVEASVDLMRHLPDAPGGTMDFLFVKLLLRYQELGCQRFSLGMAPLSGMAGHPLAPRWHRMGHLLFAHGEHFYNFQGLRAFKEKFNPQWQARYLVAPGGLAPIFVLTDIAALIAGGLKGVIAR